ncbi:MAG: hypothetical protein HY299_10650 [Verrucomicrobia bacterium]|nr:hypothetical protein [Verrucomicrobiota bacterium]
MNKSCATILKKRDSLPRLAMVMAAGCAALPFLVASSISALKASELANPPPPAVTILTPPKSQTVREGDPVQFEVIPGNPNGTVTFQWFKDGAPISGATNPVLKVTGFGAPLSRWTFETGPQDVMGGLKGTLLGGATVSQGRLKLNGSGQYLMSSPLVADIREKTLEAWIYIAAVDGTHRDVISLQTLTGNYLNDEFDAIVLGEGEPGHWRSGSDYFRRTVSFGGPVESAAPAQMVHVAAVYSADDRIAFYRNGVPYGTAYVPRTDRSTLRRYSAATSVLTLGTRLLEQPGLAGAFQGEIEEARLYDQALNAGDIARSFAAGPNSLPEGARRGAEKADSGSYTVTVTPVGGGEIVTVGASLKVQPRTLVYNQTFSTTPGSEWSSRITSVTPLGVRNFLGEFGNQTVTLSLSNLAEHTVIEASFDLFILKSWDGNNAYYGPDIWDFRVANEPPLLRTTFAHALPNNYIYPFGQAYPGGFPGGLFPPFTGAVEVGTMGYVFNNLGPMNSVYHLRFCFAHTNADLRLQFSASGLQGISDESWGLDNVRVESAIAPGGLVELATPIAQTPEEGGDAVIEVRRAGSSVGEISVDYTTISGTAKAGEDYTETAGTLVFADGETSKFISIPILPDNIPEAFQDFKLTLSNPTGGAAIGCNVTTITILDNDGFIEFSRTNYVTTELEERLGVDVRWTGDTNATVSVAIRSVDESAWASGYDFVGPIDQVITFNPGETTKTVTISPVDNPWMEDEERFRLELYNPTGVGSLGAAGVASVVILDNDTPSGAGRGLNERVQSIGLEAGGNIVLGGGFSYANGVFQVDVTRFDSEGAWDAKFANNVGANAQVECVLPQPDGKILVGGGFTTFNSAARNRITRLNRDGSLDSGFSAGTGADNTVRRILLQSDGKIILVGDFTTLAGVARNRIGRLNPNGSLDMTFDPGSGANNSIYGVALQSTGRIIISGPFSTFNGAARNRLARVNADGSLDNSFVVGSGMNGRANVILPLQGDKLLLGGGFTTINGVSAVRMARLNANGSLDTSFSVGGGANDGVQAMALQPDGKIVVGGDWTTWDGAQRARIVRVNTNGVLDNTFAAGGGANATVSALAVLPDGRVAVGGAFKVLNGFNRYRFALLDGNGGLPPEPLRWVQWTSAYGGNDHWYSFTSRPLDWRQAEAEAITWKGHLADIASHEEASFVQRTFLVGLNQLRPFWIGFNDAASEGKFVWSSDAPAPYTDWSPGEPNNSSNEDYAAINWAFSYRGGSVASDLGQWNDLSLAGSPNTGMADGPYFGIMETAVNPNTPTTPLSWVAFNDFAPGPGTHSNATSIHVFTNQVGFLRDIRTGDNLPVSLTIESFGASGANVSANPAPGTPASNVFGGFVDFSPGASGTNQSIEVAGTDAVTYRFSGLDPDRRYRFIGTAIRGEDTYTNRWALVEIYHAADYVPSHTPGVLTSNQTPTLRANQAALNTGRNHTADSGDFVAWVGIQPTPDGTFTIICRQYTGPVPGGKSDGVHAYSITGLSLAQESVPPDPTVWVRQPAPVFATVGSVALFQTAVLGYGPVAYQWRKNGVDLPGETNPGFRIASAQSEDQGLYDTTASSPSGVTTNRSAALTIVVKPFLITPPLPQTNLVAEGRSATFYVEAGGDLPLSYRWQKNGLSVTNAILNAHRSLFTVANATFTTGTRITVVVTNAYDVLGASAPAWLVAMHDADHDGMGDEWETSFGLDPANPLDASVDSDLDGLSNLAEFSAGTNPTNTTSVLRLEAKGAVGSSDVVLSFDAMPHKSYILEAADSLSSQDWQTVSIIAPEPIARTVTTTNSPAISAGGRFYRARTPAFP